MCAGTSACSAGSGEGTAMGTLSVKSCDRENVAFDLSPDFFAAEKVDGALELRVQRGGNLFIYSDGMTIYVHDVAVVRTQHLGQPIQIDPAPGALVQASLYLNSTCPSNFDETPVSLPGIAGQITFSAIYDAEHDNDQKRNQATFDIHFVHQEKDENREAFLSGAFDFEYKKGSPAQRFQ